MRGENQASDAMVEEEKKQINQDTEGVAMVSQTTSELMKQTTEREKT